MRSLRSAGRGSERVGWRWTSACGSLADAALHIAGVCAAQRAGGIFKLLLCTGIHLSALRLSRYVPASTCTRRKAVLARCAGPLATVQLAAPGARTRRRGGASACGAHCGGAVSLCGWPDSRSLQCCTSLVVVFSFILRIDASAGHLAVLPPPLTVSTRGCPVGLVNMPLRATTQGVHALEQLRAQRGSQLGVRPRKRQHRQRQRRTRQRPVRRCGVQQQQDGRRRADRRTPNHAAEPRLQHPALPTARRATSAPLSVACSVGGEADTEYVYIYAPT